MTLPFTLANGCLDRTLFLVILYTYRPFLFPSLQFRSALHLFLVRCLAF
jgi:hypothetical protein